MPALEYSFPIPDGPTIQRMGFGAMRICGPGVWGMPTHPEAARTLLRRVVERGVNFIDTGIRWHSPPSATTMRNCW